MTSETKAPYHGNIATLGEQVSNGRRLDDKKELVQEWQLVVFDAGFRPMEDGRMYDERFRTAVHAFWYMGRSPSASVVYCAVWIHSQDRARYWSGSGRAGGYGYDKKSAALEEAMHSASATFERSFGGCGDDAAKHDMRAVMLAAGWDASLPWTIL